MCTSIELYLHRFSGVSLHVKTYHAVNMKPTSSTHHHTRDVHEKETMDSLMFDTICYETTAVKDRKMCIEIWIVLNQKRFTVLMALVYCSWYLIWHIQKHQICGNGAGNQLPPRNRMTTCLYRQMHTPQIINLTKKRWLFKSNRNFGRLKTVILPRPSFQEHNTNVEKHAEQKSDICDYCWSVARPGKGDEEEFLFA